VDLAGQAQRNLIQTQQQWARRVLVVTGVVQSTTLVPREQINVSVGFTYQATATVSQDQIPLVVLQPGSVQCFFEPFDIEDAAPLKPGDAVSLKCHVDSFRPGSPSVVSVLSGCRRGDRW